MLYSMAVSGLLVLAAVLAAIFVFHVGRGASAPDIKKLTLPPDCRQTLHKILPGTHVVTLGAKVKWNSFPPTSGAHYAQPAPWNFYADQINPRITLHNLEHGGIDIFYGKKVPQSEIQQLQSFWQSNPNAILVAPMPKPDKNTIVPRPIPNYSHKIVLAAWTAAAYGTTRGAVTPGDGYLLVCGRFHENVFANFRDQHRGKGPERFPVSDLTPGA
jgi:hypothetical protein